MNTVIAWLSGLGGKILGIVTLAIGIFTSGVLLNRSKQKKHHQKKDMKDLEKQYQADGAIREKNDKEVFDSMRDKFNS